VSELYSGDPDPDERRDLLPDLVGWPPGLGLRVRACPRNGPPETPTFASVGPANRRLPAAQPQPLLPAAAAFLGRVEELTLDTPPSSRPGDSDRPARRRRPAQPRNRCPARQ
jgi:hypothetical protein